MKRLNREGYSDIHSKDIQAFQKLITCQVELQKNPRCEVARSEEYQAAMVYRQTHKTYLEFLTQKAKMSWCRDGDENSALFHQSIKARRMKNTVYPINDSDGHWQDNPHDVNKAFLAYYEQLLGNSMQHRTKVYNQVIEKGLVLQSEQMQMLTRPYTAQEVKVALFSIPGDKSPGPDGYGTHFFRDT